MTKKLIGKACKHAFQTFHKYNRDHDLLCAKITEYYDDGSEESKLAFREDFKRPFYIVLPKYRTFTDKRDYIELTKVKKYSSNQARLPYNISKVLYGRPDPTARLDEIKNSPYVFGCQESPAVILKQFFYDNYNDAQNKAKYSVAAYDVEAYITEDGIGEINMASVTFEDKVYWCGVRSFFQGDDDETILRKLKEHEEKYLDQEYLKKHNVKIVYELVDTAAECVINNVKAFHRFAPDYIVSWNANFDMEANENALIKAQYDLAQVYSDPKIPDHYKDYNYYKGREFKRKVDGSKTSLDMHERFPVLRAPATWQWFDAMSFYAISRTAGGKKESYTLQFTAQSEGIKGKLYTEEGSQLLEGSTDWHKYMQKHYPYIYAMYNIQDNFVIEELNRKTNDYSLALPSLITSSELPSYQSQPTLISDELSFIALKHGYVWGTVGSTKKDKYKDLKPDLRDWIALLHTELNEDNGISVFKTLPSWRSRGHHSVSDIDVTGAYPHVTVALNVSNRTTKFEVCKIDELDRIDFRRFGVNYASSPTANATTLAKTLYSLPDMAEIKEFYVKEVIPFIQTKEKEKV